MSDIGNSNGKNGRDSGPALPLAPEEGPLTPTQSALLCSGCVRCCTYVAIEVDAPDMPWLYDQYIWLLYHKSVWMYVERGNKWYVQFETVCEKLTPEGRCSVHGRHPVLCKDYDPRSCERRGVLTDVRARFFTGEDLVEWMREHRPVHFQRYEKWFAEQHAPATQASGDARHSPGAKRLVRYAMPPPPANPLLALLTPASRVVYKKREPMRSGSRNGADQRKGVGRPNSSTRQGPD